MLWLEPVQGTALASSSDLDFRDSGRVTLRVHAIVVDLAITGFSFVSMLFGFCLVLLSDVSSLHMRLDAVESPPSNLNFFAFATASLMNVFVAYICLKGAKTLVV